VFSIYYILFKSIAKTVFFLAIFRSGLCPISRSSAASMSLRARFLGEERFIIRIG